MAKVFIDGQEGTTGLQIQERLKARPDIELLEIDSELRKDIYERKKYLNSADIVILCLPDEAARETISLIETVKTKIIDASTAHRTSPGWVYGLPELTKGHRDAVRKARFVANPGCYPTGFILLIRPLIEKGFLEPSSRLSCHALSGYSGAGKKLIAIYEGHEKSPDLQAPRPYALTLQHKHLPEMRALTMLSNVPLFSPVVGPYYNGMIVSVPLFVPAMHRGADMATIHSALSEFYANEPFIKVMPLDAHKNLEGGFLSPTSCNGTNRCELFVFGSGDQVMISARFDNLGKGASGAAIQNMNLMLGLPETTGLDI
jgi:N-acetyl-gamma-glutamyl-phosphate reductase